MSLDDAISRLLRELTGRVAKEQDTEKLHDLVLGINRLLDAMETQLAKVEGHSDS
jgi:CHAD domain-containing protein